MYILLNRLEAHRQRKKLTRFFLKMNSKNLFISFVLILSVAAGQVQQEGTI